MSIIFFYKSAVLRQILFLIQVIRQFTKLINIKAPNKRFLLMKF